jgi:DNA polymerase V
MLHFVTEYDPETEGYESSFGINLNSELIKNPNSTYLVKMDSDAMQDAHILSGDLLVIDKSPIPKTEDIVLAFLNGERLIRILQISKNNIALRTTSDNVYIISGEDLFEIFGVVTSVIRHIRAS